VKKRSPFPKLFKHREARWELRERAKAKGGGGKKEKRFFLCKRVFSPRRRSGGFDPGKERGGGREMLAMVKPAGSKCPGENAILGGGPVPRERGKAVQGGGGRAGVKRKKH